MVVGAGRGPLVTASLAAAKRAERKIRVYAVEKNPNAIVTYVTTNFNSESIFTHTETSKLVTTPKIVLK